MSRNEPFSVARKATHQVRPRLFGRFLTGILGSSRSRTTREQLPRVSEITRPYGGCAEPHDAATLTLVEGASLRGMSIEIAQ
jgi:hypothetical protein